MNKNSNRGLIMAMVLSAVIIAGGMVFLGLQYNQKDQNIDESLLETKIEEGIQKFIKKQIQAQKQARNNNNGTNNDRIKNVRRVSASRDHIRGNPKAELTLIEYSDFECPFCKRFHPTALKIISAYKGRVNWVYRHFPLDFHNPGAKKEAEASECVTELGGNKAFWKYADLIFQRTKSNGKGFPISNLTPLAVEIGLDKASFQKCLDSGRYENRVKDDLNEGASVGITGTPGNILLNNKTGEVRLVSGAQPFINFKTIIDQLLLPK